MMGSRDRKADVSRDRVAQLAVTLARNKKITSACVLISKGNLGVNGEQLLADGRFT